MAQRSVPLRYRLPNPPPVFVGRGAEVEHLTDALSRAPLVVVWGEPGMGKSALVLRTLHNCFGDHIDRVMYVPVPPDSQVRQVLAEALEALSRAVHDAPTQSVPSDNEALVEAALDLAEANEYWLVLDGLAGTEREEVQALFGLIARYARQSRWIVVTRSRPGSRFLPGQVVPLKPLPEDELNELARVVCPECDSEDVEQALAISGGSPRRLLEELQDAASRVAMLAVPPAPDPLRMLHKLVLLDLAIPLDAARSIEPSLTPEIARSLMNRGLLESSPAGVRVPDAVRERLEHQLPRGDALEVGRRLSKLSSPAPVAEAVCLLLACGEDDEARLLLEKHGDALFAAGFAGRIWRSIAPCSTGPLAGYRLRCALEAADPQVLSDLRAPDDPNPEVQVLWVRALYSRGDVREAAHLADQLSARVTEPRLSFELGLVQARCFANLGDKAKAVARLEALEPPDANARAVLASQISQYLFWGGDVNRAMEDIEALERRLPELEPVAALDVAAMVALRLYALGWMKRAAEVLDTALGRVEPQFAFGYVRALIARALIALFSGDLPKSQELCQRAFSLAPRGALLNPFVVLVDANRRMAVGELAGLEDAVEQVLDEALERSLHDVYSLACTTRLGLAMLRGDADAAIHSLGPQQVQAYEELFTLAHFWADSRVGDDYERDEWPKPDAQHFYDFSVLARLAISSAELSAGDAQAAKQSARSAVRAARERGFWVRVAEGLLVQCEALVVLDATDELAAAAQELSEIAARLPAPRFANEAQFYAAVAQTSPRPAALEPLVACDDVAPVAARRARALLGDEAVLDRIDTLVVDAVRRRTRLNVRVLSAAEERPTWGLDERHSTVWLPDGREVELAEHPVLLKLVESLARLGGDATKEQLVQEVWEVREYHPLRHDNRLQGAVRNLRKLIEEDPKNPKRFVTTQGGYRFGPPAPRWLPAQSE